jgi:hypothetical protein
MADERLRPQLVAHRAKGLMPCWAAWRERKHGNGATGGHRQSRTTDPQHYGPATTTLPRGFRRNPRADVYAMDEDQDEVVARWRERRPLPLVRDIERRAMEAARKMEGWEEIDAGRREQIERAELWRLVLEDLEREWSRR